MNVVRSVADVRAAVSNARARGEVIGFVPTMGFLHQGHLSLVDVARQHGATFIVVSIFVNPTQFGPHEDFASYPRNEDGDIALLESRNVELLFAPPPTEVYPDGFATTVHVAGVSEPLEGARRPGHFDGVATVVLKLFGMVNPDLAVFGRKDAQQCAVISRMTVDLNLSVRLVFGETVREGDGLAMSSRNAYLSAEERRIAPVLHRALQQGAAMVHAPGSDSESIEDAMHAVLSETGAALDYIELVDPVTFARPEDLRRDLLLVGAIRLGATRLIDNILVSSTVPSAQLLKATSAIVGIDIADHDTGVPT